MRRPIGACLIALSCLFAAPSVYAHLTGAFAEYLATVYDESTTDKLREDLETTKQEIAKLAPELDGLQRQFAEDRDAAADKLLFYRDRGLDLWLGMLQGEGSLVDRLGNEWLLERQLRRELDKLDDLYRSYLQLDLTRQSLAGREELLGAIERNLAQRQPFLDSVGDLGVEETANYLDIDWASEVEEPLKAALLADRLAVTEGWSDWLSESKVDGRTELRSNWLNDLSDLTYYFRADHLYAVYESDLANVILIGQLLQNAAGNAEYVIEAGFYNGFSVPDKALEELTGFELPYAELRERLGVGERAYLQQEEGTIAVAGTDY
ncbi:coiled-coil domain-containing protein [Cohnella fermenti]|uniref:SbsC C-terminal domain-containing protein n=1 Tax=Cohnella fermenti TaxID=2565925 RepID=A0A4S4BP36_9BACL|nr:hypothetical protein [Cohnella fermenti]THF75757.1 hypothetical protein E6C55_21125 [Cohnella fermenti]